MAGWLTVMANEKKLVGEATAPTETSKPAQRSILAVAAGDDQTIISAIASLPTEGGIVELGAGTFLIITPS